METSTELKLLDEKTKEMIDDIENLLEKYRLALPKMRTEFEKILVFIQKIEEDVANHAAKSADKVLDVKRFGESTKHHLEAIIQFNVDDLDRQLLIPINSRVQDVLISIAKHVSKTNDTVNLMVNLHDIRAKIFNILGTMPSEIITLVDTVPFFQAIANQTRQLRVRDDSMTRIRLSVNVHKLIAAFMKTEWKDVRMSAVIPARSTDLKNDLVRVLSKNDVVTVADFDGPGKIGSHTCDVYLEKVKEEYLNR